MFRTILISLTASLFLLSSCSSPAKQDVRQAPAAESPKSAYEADPSGWTDLLAKSNLEGWSKFAVPPSNQLNPKEQWTLQNGVLTIDGTGGHEWLRYNAKKFGNFVLHAEWRFRKVTERETKYNGGIYFWADDNGAQFYQAQTAEAGGWLFGDFPKGAEKNRVNLREKMSRNMVLPAGEWNTYEIRATPEMIALKVNGQLQSQWNAPPVTNGYLGLEAEGYFMEFRKLLVKELP